MIDGDTITVGQTRIRLFGIDAPEMDQTCVSPDGTEWSCGVWVTAQVRSLIEGESVGCTALDRDRYDRVVARCSFAGNDLGRELVAAGLAFAYRRYSMDYDLDEKGAAVRGTGLHAHQVQSPADYRRTQSDRRETGVGRCAIKGNISRNGARIYHVPGQKDYARTTIRPETGERFFCSEVEAKAAGWRPAKR